MQVNTLNSTSLRSGFLGMLANRGLGLAIGFVSSIVLARWLGPAGRGDYAVYTTTLGLLTIFLGLGIWNANTILAGRKIAPHRQLVFNSLIYSILIPIPVILLASILPASQIIKWTQMTPAYWRLAGIGLWLGLSALSVQGILLGAQDYNSYNLLNALQSMLTLCVAVVTLIALASGVTGLIWGSIGVSGLVLLAGLILVMKSISCVEKGGVSWTLFRSTVAIGARSALHFRLVIFLVGAYLGIEAVGFYALASTLTTSISFLPPLLNNLVFSHVPSTGIRSARSVIQTGYITMVVALAAAIGFALIGRPAIAFLYTEAFLPSYTPLVILLIAEIFRSHAALSAGFLAGLGYPRIYLIGSVASLAINVGLNLLLIPAFQTTGAALTAVISYAALAVIYGYGVMKHGRLSPSELRPSPTFVHERLTSVMGLRRVQSADEEMGA
jgi:O-antigen/teichoic acid export membrane protein